MAGFRESGWLNARRADGRRARDTMMMMLLNLQGSFKCRLPLRICMDFGMLVFLPTYARK